VRGVYDVSDTTIENVDKDYVSFNEVGFGFSSVITYYTSDEVKGDALVDQMRSRGLVEEKVWQVANDTIVFHGVVFDHHDFLECRLKSRSHPLLQMYRQRLQLLSSFEFFQRQSFFAPIDAFYF
jgi:hypothetical protein